LNKQVVVPASPEAASLGKYGNLPVNLYTGTPKVSIPLGSLGTKNISTSISLNYNASGNKVADVPSTVGMAWSLNTGGVISRTVMGNPDMKSNYYDQLDKLIDYRNPNSNLFNEYNFFDDVTKGFIETQPDLYSFNVGGFSGSFYVLPQTYSDGTRGFEVVTKNVTDVKIRFINSGSDASSIFILTDSQGNEYEFSTLETSVLQLDDDRPVVRLTYTHTSSWFLTKITSYDQKETISFAYDTDLPYTQPVNPEKLVSVSYSASGINNTLTEKVTYGGISTNTIQRKFLKTITHSFANRTTTATFTLSNADINKSSGKKLDEVLIETGDIKQKWQFTYDYGNNRLRLKELTESGFLTTWVSKPPYKFDYNATDLPSFTSCSIDHWGFYNSNANGGTKALIPSKTIGSTFYEGGNANREANETNSKAGIIDKMTYPTGGFTQFQFEGHSGKKLTSNEVIPVGGVRVKSILDYTADGVLASKKDYEYLETDGSTSGKSFSELYYDDQSSFTASPSAASCPPIPGDVGGIGNGEPSTTIRLWSNSMGELTTDQGTHIGYSRVVEKFINGAKTVYSYRTDDNGDLLGKEDYNGTTLVAKQELKYSIDLFTENRRQKNFSFYAIVPKTEQDNKEILCRVNPTGGTISVPVLSDLNGDGIIQGNEFYCNTVSCGPYSTSYVWKPLLALHTECPTCMSFKNCKTKYTRKVKNFQRQWRYVAQTTNTQYYNGQAISVVTKNYYDNANVDQPTRTEMTDSEGKTHTTKTYFIDDITSATTHVNFNNKQLFIDRNLRSVPLLLESYIGTGSNKRGVKIEHTIFDNDNNRLYPSSYYTLDNNGNWILNASIELYNTFGIPTKVRRKGFSVTEDYAFGLNDDRMTAKSFGGLTSSFAYRGTTSMLEYITDENGIRKKFTYDGLQRLSKVDDRFKPDGTDVQATANTLYNYKTSPTDNNYIQSNANFKNVAATQTSKQFMDGLGRTFMTERFNNDNTYTKTYITYDALGRTDKTYEPIVSNTEGVDVNYLTTVLVNKNYTQPTYEASPLSRPTAQRNLDGSFVYMAYNTNTATEVLKFTVSSYDIVYFNGFYDVNSLMKTTITNENGKLTHVFKDKLGRVVLTRKILNGGNVDTYNVYDDYGQLVMVIPPGAIEANTNAIKLSLVFSYKYDNQNRLCRKKVPSADWQIFYYDKRDLLTLVQDGNMRNPTFGGAANKYLGTQYNAIGQVLKTGWVTDTTGLWAGNIVITDANKLTEIQYYPNSTWVKNQAARVLKPTGVATEREFVWSYIERRPGLEYTGNPVWTGKQHIMSKTYRYGNTLIGDEPIDDNDYGGVDWRVSAYDGAQKPTVTYHYLYSGPSSNNRAQEVREFSRFSYDNLQRLTTVKYDYARLGAQPVEPTFILSNMNYNYKDQLVEKNTAFVNNKYLQSTDFTYNVRGWLTSINSGFLSSTNDYPLFTCTNYNAFNYYTGTTFQTPSAQVGEHNPDLFTEKIRYDSPTYYYPGASAGQSNGNISQIEWQVAGREAQGYSFKYDDLDRLTEANYTDIHSAGWASKGWSSQYGSDNKFNEAVTYDLRGNIQSMSRRGLNFNSMSSNSLMCGYFSAIDNLAYTYNAADLNKLDKVTDGASTSLGFKTATNNSTYTYDSNGNLISDGNKNILNISYNYLNLPLVITFTSNNRIEFIYDATGAKLRKTVFTNNVATEKRDYVNGVEYKNDILDRIPHTEGAVVRNENDVFEHQYVIKDHLGNARVTYRDGINKANNTGNTVLNDGTITVADMMQINHYYPFGMNMEGNWNGPSGKNKYQYNGKELNNDFGLGWNDYGFRMYDPAVGRWSVVDALSEKYYCYSPYHYAKDNPVRNIDLLGLAAYDQVGNEKKEIVYLDDKGNSHRGLAPRGNHIGGDGGDGGNDWIRKEGSNQFEYVPEKGLTLGQAKHAYGSNVAEVQQEGFVYHAEGGKDVRLLDDKQWEYANAADAPINLLDKTSLGVGFAVDIKSGILVGAGKLLDGVSGKFDGVFGKLKDVGGVLAWSGVAADFLTIGNKFIKGDKIGWGDGAKIIYDTALALSKFNPVLAVTIGLADGLWDLSGGKDKFFNNLNKY
jgi:RHS repeat-associated protein